MIIVHVLKHPLTGVMSSLLNLIEVQSQRHKVYVFLQVKSDWPKEYLRLIQESGVEYKIAPLGSWRMSYLALFFKRDFYDFAHKIKNKYPNSKIIAHHHNSEWSSCFMGSWYKNVFDKVVVTFHGIPGILPQFKRRRPLQKVLKKYLDIYSDHYISVDTDSLNKAKEILGYSPGQFEVIPNGIKITHFENISVKNNTEFTVGFIGTIDDNKGWDIIIDSVARLRDKGFDVDLLIAGDGHLKSKLLEHISDKSHYIKYLGSVSDVINDFYLKVDLVVIASKAEGMPMVALESINQEITLLSTPLSFIEDFKSKGIIINVCKRNHEDIANNIKSIKDNLFFYDAKKNKELLTLYYSNVKVADKYDEIYFR